MANTSSKTVPNPKPAPATKSMPSSKPGLTARMSKFLRETWIELKKTAWPSWDEMKKSTLLVLAAVLVITIWIGGLDFILGFLFKQVGL